MQNVIRSTMKSARLVLAILGGLAMTLLTSVSLAQASTPVTTCGQVLGTPGDYHLTGNLTCPGTGNGVEITASNVHFTLAGFTISGSSCTVGTAGIHVNPGGVAGALSGVRIDGGTVTGFNDGIDLIITSKSRVTAMTVTGACVSGFGIVLSTSPNNEIDTNVVTGNLLDGVGLAESSGNSIHSNDISANFRFGVILFQNSDKNTIRNNILNTNGLAAGGAGILVASGNKNRILSNAVNANLNGISLSTVVTGNVIQDNTANGNTNEGIAIAATATTNQVQGNTARGNGSFDLTDGNPGCDSNTWKNNTFGTADPGTGCIK